MIRSNSFILIDGGFIPGYTDQKLYIIQYHEHTLYVGKSTGKRGYNLPCRIGRHFGANIDGCMRQNDRSGASRQFNIMINKLPNSVKYDFTIIALNPHDLSNFVNLDEPQIRLKMVSVGLSAADIRDNKQTKQVIDFCETALAWSLCPVYDKSGNSRCSNGLPDGLIQYLIKQ